MTEWRVVIADDEPAARRGVRLLLAPFPHFAVAAECRNGFEVLKALEGVEPDVLFLDIEMPGLDGFEVLARRHGRAPLIVFLTAHAQFAVEAFEAEALDYLLKPVSEERFAATISRVERVLRHGAGERSLFRVITARGVLLLDSDAVEWIEAAGNYARLWVDGRNYLVRESLSDLEPRLREKGFLRIHRGVVVRLDSVKALTRDRDGAHWALLRSGAKVPVARRRRAILNSAVRQMGDR